MKLNIYLIGAFFGMLILASCGNDDDETPVPKDDSWYWGYFKGEINGKEISLENEAHTDWSVHSVKTSASPPNNDTDSIRGMMTSIKYGEDELLEEGSLWLKYHRKKNKMLARVKLLPEALAMLEKYKDPTRPTLLPPQEFRVLRGNMKSLRVLSGISMDLVLNN